MTSSSAVAAISTAATNLPISVVDACFTACAPDRRAGAAMMKNEATIKSDDAMSLPNQMAVAATGFEK